MKRDRKQWYLVAYDIRQDKRLRRLHYYLKKEAVALQKSVFLLHADKARLRETTSQIKSRVSDSEDDVRIYPIYYPNAIWGAGKQSLALQNLYTGFLKRPSENAGWRKRLKKFFGGN